MSQGNRECVVRLAVVAPSDGPLRNVTVDMSAGTDATLDTAAMAPVLIPSTPAGWGPSGTPARNVTDPALPDGLRIAIHDGPAGWEMASPDGSNVVADVPTVIACDQSTAPG